MNEQQAKDRGYSSTGIYGRSKDEVAQRLSDLVEMGYKAVITTVPDSPYSRGTVSTGYSVYAERKYFTDREIASFTTGLSHIDGMKENALEKYREALADIESDKARMEQRLEELNKLSKKED